MIEINLPAPRDTLLTLLHCSSSSFSPPPPPPPPPLSPFFVPLTCPQPLQRPGSLPHLCGWGNKRAGRGHMRGLAGLGRHDAAMTTTTTRRGRHRRENVRPGGELTMTMACGR
ncbi:hypothetical protein E2C01_032193 [Portunus trituberculatus]|uniref:Uncharacterized protein n=1 Tax=Portunus trituberculatus TaxID=210409 RepID=A0A5B7EVE1_PORTR|nr:hypothetical protein [Portunus trituberculatus]